MDLIKKSVSVTESEYKTFIARMTILFLKELKLLHYWYEYTNTDRYHDSVADYLKTYEGKNYTEVWNDREDCMKVLGMCNFGDYLKTRGILYDTYNLYAAFLAIFCVDEFDKWAVRMGEKDCPSDFIHRVGHFNNLYKEIIDNWVKFKKALE